MTGLGTYPDGMVEHDGHVGQLLKKLDDLGIADNTLVMWSTDNGAEVFTWPDGGTTPFRGSDGSEPKSPNRSEEIAQVVPAKSKEPDSTGQKVKAAEPPKSKPDLPPPERASKKDDEAGAKKAETPELPVWKADADLLKNLGTEIRVGPYRVRPPKGYERVMPPQDPKGLAESYWWASKPRADGTRAQFSVMIITIPPGTERNMASLEEMHERNLER